MVVFDGCNYWIVEWHYWCRRGIFLSPLLLLFKWSDVKTTAGISALFIWVNSASGLVGSSLSGEFVLDFDILLPFTLAVVTGGFHWI